MFYRSVSDSQTTPPLYTLWLTTLIFLLMMEFQNHSCFISWRFSFSSVLYKINSNAFIAIYDKQFLRLPAPCGYLLVWVMTLVWIWINHVVSLQKDLCFDDWAEIRTEILLHGCSATTWPVLVGFLHRSKQPSFSAAILPLFTSHPGRATGARIRQ